MELLFSNNYFSIERNHKGDLVIMFADEYSCEQQDLLAAARALSAILDGATSQVVPVDYRAS